MAKRKQESLDERTPSGVLKIRFPKDSIGGRIAAKKEKSVRAFDRWWKRCEKEIARRGVPDSTFADLEPVYWRDAYQHGSSPKTAVKDAIDEAEIIERAARTRTANSTPGPWEARARGAVYAVPWNCHITTAIGGEVGNADALANARLIAAAPELLAACEKTLFRLQELYRLTTGRYCPGMPKEEQALVETLRAALQKAGVKP